MREVISNGTPRMPGFKHHFEPAQIDAIVAYLKTVPAQRHRRPAANKDEQGETPCEAQRFSSPPATRRSRSRYSAATAPATPPTAS